MTDTLIGSEQELRQRAEEKLNARADKFVEPHSREKTEEFIHELRVHQIELEMQNEDLRRAQNEIASVSALYFDLYDLAPVGFLTFNKNGLIQKANLAAATMLGVVRMVLIKNLMSRFIFPIDEEIYTRHRNLVIETGDVQSWDMRLIRADGTPFWVHMQASPAKNGEYLVTFNDITDQKLQEEVLQSRLRISDYVHNHTLDELLEKVLDEAENLSGSQISFFHFVDSDQVTLTLQTWSVNTLAILCTSEGKGRHYPLSSAGVWADCIREKRPVIHNNYEALPNRKGLPPGHAPVQRELVVPISRNDLIVAVIGVGNKTTDYTEQDLVTVQNLANLAWDIVKRKRAEESLRSTEKKFSWLFESMTDAYVSVDLEGLIVESNAAFQNMTGYSPEELQSLTYMQLTPDTWHTYEAEIIERQVLARGNSDVYEKEYKRRDGSIIDVELKTYLLTDDDGKPAGMWAIIRDITDRKRKEKEFLKAKEAAEAANIAKSDFLATISHEIRTPLSAMLGNIDLLENSSPAPQQQEYLKDCKFASQMLLQVINDVLDFSKIEAGKLELVYETFSITALSTQLARIFKASALQKGLELTVSLADDLPEYIYSDLKRLRQIISNLINNAIKFTNFGSVSLKIVRDQEAILGQDKAVLRIEISDTGIGISPENQVCIFESFTQIERFSTRSVTGTGLGLAICRRLLALMGGSISISSIPDMGSTFTVVLPVTVVKAQAQAQAQALILTSPRKILLADDDGRGRTVAQKLLQRRGYQVTAVENGTDLLDALQNEDFDLVITDISMPDMEGTRVAQIIRSGEREGINKHIPIIAMTAHAFSDDRTRFLSAGINGYVAKPVNLDDLFRQIEELCKDG